MMMKRELKHVCCLFQLGNVNRGYQGKGYMGGNTVCQVFVSG